MAAQQHHPLIIVGGLGVAGFLGYEFIYKPWADANAAAAAASLTGTLPFPTGASSLVTAPSVLGTAAPGGVQGSIVDPRVSPGGDVGYAMWLKNWTQAQAQTRLTALQNAYAAAKQAIANLQSNVNNPAAAGIPAAQAQLNTTQAALAAAQQAFQQLTDAKNTVGAAQYAAAIQGYNSDIADLTARIRQAQQPSDNTAAIATYQGQMAANDTDYFNLTTRHLS
jgi:hypothetical protein